MRQFLHLFLLLALGSFAIGCSPTPPPEGTPDDEQAIEDDTGMQEAEMAGDPVDEGEGGGGGDGGAPE